MSNRKLLLKARQQAGVTSSNQTLREDVRLFAHAIPEDFLAMDKDAFWRHFNKLYQTNYILTCLYTNQLVKSDLLKDYQLAVVRGFFPDLGD